VGIAEKVFKVNLLTLYYFIIVW